MFRGAGSIVGALYHKLWTQSSAPEGGRNYRPKHVELIEIINEIIIVASSWLFILLFYDSPLYYSAVYPHVPLFVLRVIVMKITN